MSTGAVPPTRTEMTIGVRPTMGPQPVTKSPQRVGVLPSGSVVRAKVPARTVWAGNPAVQLKEDIRDLVCFAGIYPHAYSWLADLPAREKVGV